MALEKIFTKAKKLFTSLSQVRKSPNSLKHGRQLSQRPLLVAVVIHFLMEENINHYSKVMMKNWMELDNILQSPKIRMRLKYTQISINLKISLFLRDRVRRTVLDHRSIKSTVLLKFHLLKLLQKLSTKTVSKMIPKRIRSIQVHLLQKVDQNMKQRNLILAQKGGEGLQIQTRQVLTSKVSNPVKESGKSILVLGLYLEIQWLLKARSKKTLNK